MKFATGHDGGCPTECLCRRPMGLFKLLTFPVSGPLAGGKWILQTLLDEAERRYYDETAIQQELAEVGRDHQAGRIDDETFEQREEQLLQRLLEARDHHRRKRQGSSDAEIT
jgi:hypothetical protein